MIKRIKAITDRDPIDFLNRKIKTRAVAAIIKIIFPVSKRVKRPRIQRRQSLPAPQPVPPQRLQRRAKSLHQINWCYCNGPDIGTMMICCDNLQCQTRWFHMDCLGEEVDINDEWFCRNCR